MDSRSDQEATEQPPSVVTMSSVALTECQYAQQLVQTYFCMLMVGCKGPSHSSVPETQSSSVERCSNAYCKSNSDSKLVREISPADAAILSVHLATQAPIPLCIPIVSYFPVPQQQQDDARPETDDEDQEQTSAHACSTPRRRLSSAVELDLTFSINSHDIFGIGADLSDRELLVTRRPLDGRRLSLPKQKLLDAIKSSFPGIVYRKQRAVDLSSNNHPAER